MLFRSFEVSVASVGRKATGAQGTTIEMDLTVADAKESNYDALFVAGGNGMVAFSKDKGAQRLLRKFLRAGKPVAMVCHAPLLAAEARVAAGRQVTGRLEIRSDMERAGAKWTGMPLERDGMLFTATGSDDAEPLAFVLASCLKGRALGRTARLDKGGTMRKLAAIWALADAIGKLDPEQVKGMTEQQVEALISPFLVERGEPATEPTVRTEPKLAPTVFEPKKEPKPKDKPKTHESKRWGVSLSFEPPAVDGRWIDPGDAAPAGFPFDPVDLGDGPSLRALFQKEETWDKLGEMVQNPAKRGLLQSYLLPKVVLAIGKEWWGINRFRKQLGNAPFGVLDDNEREKMYKDKDLDDTILGRAFIAQINRDVADLQIGRAHV